MFSPEFMRFLINYQKPDKSEFETKKEIKLKNKDNNCNLDYIFLTKKKKKRAFLKGSLECKLGIIPRNV